MPQTKKNPKKILPKISGHETFTLKYGWIKKIVDEVEKAENTDPESLKDLFKSDDAIVRFGIGRNMVNSLKYWATSTCLVHAENLTLTSFSKDFFAADGKNLFFERFFCCRWLRPLLRSNGVFMACTLQSRLQQTTSNLQLVLQ